MKSLNRVQLIGNATADPEMKQTKAGGTVFTAFNVATNKTWKDKVTNEEKSEVEFHSVIAFGKLAELCANFIKKGHRIWMEGELKTSSWTDTENVKRFKTNIVMNNLMFLTAKQSDQKPEERLESREESYSDDLPFS